MAWSEGLEWSRVEIVMLMMMLMMMTMMHLRLRFFVFGLEGRVLYKTFLYIVLYEDELNRT